MPTLYVVAGPNGCGKSTLTRVNRLNKFEVIDPDEIARSMKPVSPERAAREALRRRRAAIAEGRTFVVETTLAGNSVLRLLETAQESGFRIVVHYVCVQSPDLALVRIRNRVALGGHDVPEVDARRRFARSLVNLQYAVACADKVYLYDNTRSGQPHREVARFTEGSWWTAEHAPDWAASVVPSMPSLHRRCSLRVLERSSA